MIRYVTLFFLIIADYSVNAGPGESTKAIAERMEYARAAEKAAIHNKDSSMLAEAYYLWGKAYGKAGDYITSQRYFLNSLRIQRTLGDSSMVCRLYARLSENELEQRHFEPALRYAKRAVALSRYIASGKRLAIAYGALGAIHEELWDQDRKMNAVHYDSAFWCYGEVNMLMRENDDLLGMNEADRYLGRLFAKKGNPRARFHLERALPFFESEQMYSCIVPTKVYLALVELQAGNLGKALQIMQEARRLFEVKQLNDIPILTEIEKAFVAYYRRVNMPDSAMARIEYLHHLRLDQFRTDRAQVLEWLQAENEMMEKEKDFARGQEQLALQDRNLSLQKRLIIFLVIVAILATAAGLVFFRLNRYNRQISTRNVQLVKEQSHRIKNHLQMVASLLHLQAARVEDHAAREVISDSLLRVGSIALLQRQLFNKEGSAEVLLPDYVNQLVSAVLSVYGFSDIHKEIKCEDVSLPVDKAVSLGLILTELLTNACKYAFPQVVSPELKITGNSDGKSLIFSLSDNGPGFDPGNIQDSDSFGMQLIRIQTEQLYAAYDFGQTQFGGTMFKMSFRV